jgi:hypothetical protein
MTSLHYSVQRFVLSPSLVTPLPPVKKFPVLKSTMPHSLLVLQGLRNFAGFCRFLLKPPCKETSRSNRQNFPRGGFQLISPNYGAKIFHIFSYIFANFHASPPEITNRKSKMAVTPSTPGPAADMHFTPDLRGFLRFSGIHFLHRGAQFVKAS